MTEYTFHIFIAVALKSAHHCASEVHKYVISYNNPELAAGIVFINDKSFQSDVQSWMEQSGGGFIYFVASPYRIALNVLWYASLLLGLIHEGWVCAATAGIVSFFSFLIFGRIFSFGFQLWGFGIVGILSALGHIIQSIRLE
jgi:hypothetical protein